MSRIHLCVAVALAVLTAGCSSTAPAPATPDSPDRAPAPTTKSGAFSRQQLIEDTRELARNIEDTHPDPYGGGGGRIAFHRRLHTVLNAIPDEGMTRAEYQHLVRPFVAGVGEAHTNFLTPYSGDPRPDGLPLRFKVVDESLVIVAIQQSHREWLGSRLPLEDDRRGRVRLRPRALQPRHDRHPARAARKRLDARLRPGPVGLLPPRDRRFAGRRSRPGFREDPAGLPENRNGGAGGLSPQNKSARRSRGRFAPHSPTSWPLHGQDCPRLDAEKGVRS